MSDARAAIEDLVRRHSSCDTLPPADADLFAAVGIDGDDAFDLMRDFAERFQVDLKDYRWYRHHGTEGFPLFSRFLRPPWPGTLLPITVSQLERAATLHRWPAAYPEPAVPDATIRAYWRWRRCLDLGTPLAIILFFVVLAWLGGRSS